MSLHAMNGRGAAGFAAPRHLDLLESEAVHILREAAAEFANPALLFSGGKDSTVLLRLAEKAFRPGKFPFPLLHIDTGHNFPEVLEFRDRTAAALGERLIVRTVQDSIDRGRVRLKVPHQSRNALQSVTLETSARRASSFTVGSRVRPFSASSLAASRMKSSARWRAGDFLKDCP